VRDVGDTDAGGCAEAERRYAPNHRLRAVARGGPPYRERAGEGQGHDQEQRRQDFRFLPKEVGARASNRSEQAFQLMVDELAFQ
jgi:hypothetical protein